MACIPAACLNLMATYLNKLEKLNLIRFVYLVFGLCMQFLCNVQVLGFSFEIKGVKVGGSRASGRTLEGPSRGYACRVGYYRSL